MTKLKLRRDLSYCRIDDHLIFLDIQDDRYFRLTRDLESSLIAYLSGSDTPDSSIRTLVEQKILTDGSVNLDDATPARKTVPARSAMEEAARAEPASINQLLDTLTIVCSTQLQLKFRSLKNVLETLVSLREKRASQPSPRGPGQSRVLDLAATFRSARLYVPIDMCCLLDSIAMVKFLAKRELYADLVFGVTADPFSAHCWAQYRSTVLNDALGHALTFTPIRVI